MAKTGFVIGDMLEPRGLVTSTSFYGARTAYLLPALLLCGLLACAPVFATSDHSEAGVHINVMAALAQEGRVIEDGSAGTTNLDLLVTTLRERLATNATSDRLHTQLAWVYETRASQAMKDAGASDFADRKTAASGWRRQGISELKDAVRLNSRNDFAWLLLGHMQYEIGELDAALVCCRHSTNIGGTATAFWITACLLNAAEQYADAQEAAEKALARDSQCANAWVEAGIARAKLGKMDAALRAADAAVRLQPKDALILQQAARIYRLAEKFPASNALAQRANVAAPQLAENYCILARNACDLGNFTQAVENARATLQLDPFHSEAFNTIGRAYLSLGEYEASLRAFQDASKLQPQSIGYQSNVATAYEKLGRFAEAEDIFRRISTLAPGSPEWVVALSGFLERRERDNEAIVILDHAIRAGITNTGVLQNMGNALQKVGRYRDALPYLEQLAQSCPTNCAFLANLAQCYRRLNFNVQAAATWRQVNELCPTNWDYRGQFAECLAKTGHLLAAEKACREALDLAPTTNRLHDVITFQLYSIVMGQGRKAEAIDGFNRLLDSSPSNHIVRIFVADSLRQAGDMHAMEKVLLRGIEIAPDNADLWAKLAELKMHVEPAEAGRCAQRALALCPTNFVAHYALGFWNCTYQHDMVAAKANYEAAIRDDPARKEVYVGLGVMLGTAGDIDGCETNLLKALSIDPTDAEILTSLGYERYQRHDYAGAAAYHARAITADPKHGRAHFNLALACLETGEYGRGIAHWHLAREVGYKGTERLLQELERRQRAAGP